MTLHVRITHPTEYPANAEISQVHLDGDLQPHGEPQVVATLKPGESYDGCVHAHAYLVVKEVQPGSEG